MAVVSTRWQWYHPVAVKLGARDGVVVKALHYKPAGRVFDSDGVVGIFQ